MSQDHERRETRCSRRYLVWYEVVSVELIAVPVDACSPLAAIDKSRALVGIHRALRDGLPETTRTHFRRVEEAP